MSQSPVELVTRWVLQALYEGKETRKNGKNTASPRNSGSKSCIHSYQSLKKMTNFSFKLCYSRLLFTNMWKYLDTQITLGDQCTLYAGHFQCMCMFLASSAVPAHWWLNGAGQQDPRQCQPTWAECNMTVPRPIMTLGRTASSALQQSSCDKQCLQST